MAMFLENATHDQLEQAVAANHSEWMILKARAAKGEVSQRPGVTWTYAGAQGEAMILFPHLAEAEADECLDAITSYYRAHPPESLVGCWSLVPSHPIDLGDRLLARGFQLGWEPCWMWLDLRNARIHHPYPKGLQIETVVDEVDWDVEDLPYYESGDAALRYTLTHIHPQQVWHFAARLDGKLVGHSTLCLTSGPLGVVGLYDVGVVPSARNRGIGKAITLAACLHARSMGGRHVLLNATGKRMYEQLGFENIGWGMTWWLDATRLVIP